jgi:DNA-binding XRE family transcriptional regulator
LAAENVRWLHENSGLTWDQLGRLFGVSRRTVHLWANGARVNAHNTEGLALAVRMVKGIAAQTPEDRRAAILAQTNGQTSPFETFAASRRNGRELMNAPAFRAADSLGLIPGDGATGA